MEPIKETRPPVVLFDNGERAETPEGKTAADYYRELFDRKFPGTTEVDPITPPRPEPPAPSMTQNPAEGQSKP